MPRRKKIRKADSERFNELVVTVLEEIGAHEDDDDRTSHDYILVTTAGALKLTICKDIGETQAHTRLYTLWARFDYPQLVVLQPRLHSVNPFSGKWNFHISGCEDDPEEAIAQIRADLERISVAPKRLPMPKIGVDKLEVLAEAAGERGIEALSELVQDAANQVKSAVNNQGPRSRIEYVLHAIGDNDKSREMLRIRLMDAIKDN